MSFAYNKTDRIPVARRVPGIAALIVAVVACLVASLAAPAARADANTGYVIVGPVTDSWGATNGVTVGAAAIANNTASTSGQLSLELWATSVAQGAPTVRNGLIYYELGGTTIGTLGPGQQLTNVLETGLPFSPVPPGCYFVMVALLDGKDLVDLFPFSYSANADDVPSPTGYTVFPFGSGTTCQAPTSCADSANAACLVGGRFQVTTTYYNAIDGKAQAQAMSFGSTRAQSDESIFYYFTNSSNFEMGINVLDACAVNNAFWIFIGGLTNQGWEVNVLDTQTGNHKAYQNHLNNLTVTTADTTGLPCS
jgi:hypothetical protein